MNLITTDIDSYFKTLDDIKPEFTAIKVWSVLQFFRLKGRTVKMLSENIEPIPELKYCYLADGKYYYREYRGWVVEEIYFCRPTLTFSGSSDAMSALISRISLGSVYLLMTPGQISETSAILQRLWKSHFHGEGKIGYKIWIRLLEINLLMQDYDEYHSSQSGFKTRMKMFDDDIRGLWDSAYKTKR